MKPTEENVRNLVGRVQALLSEIEQNSCRKKPVQLWTNGQHYKDLQSAIFQVRYGITFPEYNEKFSVINAFNQNDIKVDEGIGDDPLLYTYKDYLCKYRIVGNDIQCAAIKSFDRWANSVDFVFSIPKTKKTFDRKLELVRSCVNDDDYDPAIGQEKRI